MTNPQQNEIENEIEQFNKDINLLQDKLKKLKNEKKANFKNENGPKKIAKNNKMHKEKKQIEGKIDLLQGRVEQFKKRQSLLEKRLKQSKREISMLHDRIEQFKKRKRG